jgi:hypothetical protein
MTQEAKKTIICIDCGKPAIYNRSRGKLCWKCKELRGKKEIQSNLNAPKRCPTCGHKITVVPCIACSLPTKKSSPNAKESNN